MSRLRFVSGLRPQFWRKTQIPNCAKIGQSAKRRQISTIHEIKYQDSFFETFGKADVGFPYLTVTATPIAGILVTGVPAANEVLFR